MSRQKMNLLLIEDVNELGKSGELVQVKPGFARNFLLPKKRAVIADKQTLRMQTKLQEERAAQAAKDRADSEELSKRLANVTLKKEVKVDPEGHMYGSVSIHDIISLLQAENFQMDKKYIHLPRPIKETGTHKVELHLKEGVQTSIVLKIIPEGIIEADVDQVVIPIKEETVQEEDLQAPKKEEEPSKDEKDEIKKATKKI